MRISERCACGATFEADDGARETGSRYQTDEERARGGRLFDVEEQARRWRAEHHHTVALQALNPLPDKEEATNA